MGNSSNKTQQLQDKLQNELRIIKKHKENLYKELKVLKESGDSEIEEINEITKKADEIRDTLDKKYDSVNAIEDKLNGHNKLISKQLEEINIKLTQSQENLSATKNLIGLTNYNKTSSDDSLIALNKAKQEILQIKKNVSNYYRQTVDLGNGGQFSRREKGYRNSAWIWLFLASLLAGTVIYLGSNIFQDNGDIAKAALRLLILSPAGFILYILIRNHNRNKSLAIQYGHKSAISLSLDAHIKMMKEIQNPDLLKFMKQQFLETYRAPDINGDRIKAAVSIEKGWFGKFRLELSTQEAIDTLKEIPGLGKYIESKTNPTTTPSNDSQIYDDTTD